MASGVTESTAESLATSFQQAAIGEQSWESALDDLAAATGANSAELIGFGTNFFNWITNRDASEFDEFARIGGYDPRINSRIRIGVRAGELQVLDETALDTGNDMQRFPDYANFLREADMHHICLTNLNKEEGAHIGLSVMRGARAGPIPAPERRLFAATAPHVRAAIRTHIALEMRAIELTASGLEQLGLAAFVLDRSGLVRAMSARGEELLRLGDLALRDGRLTLRLPGDAGLDDAVGAAISVRHVGDRSPRPVLVQGRAGLGYLLEVLPLPSKGGTPREAGALIVARPPQSREVAAARTAASVFRLTQAEAAVAGLLALGLSPRAIAERQGVGLATIRSQIHAALQKANMRSQVEFVAALLARL